MSKQAGRRLVDLPAGGERKPCPTCGGEGTIAVTLGDRIKEAREESGLTQDGLANRVGISRSQIANIEAGRVDPALATFRDIALALGRTADDLLGGQP